MAASVASCISDARHRRCGERRGGSAGYTPQNNHPFRALGRGRPVPAPRMSFRVEGLLPGLKHELTVRSETNEEDIEFWAAEALKGLTTAAGETSELDEIRMKEARRMPRNKKADNQK